MIRHRDDKQMEDRSGVLLMSLHGDQRICDLLQITMSDLLPPLRPLRQIFQADTQHCPLQTFQPVVVTDLIMIIPHITALILQTVDMLIIFFFLTGNTAALTKGVEVLARVEAEAGQVSQRSRISVLKLCSVSLGTILHHKQSVTVCDLTDSRIVKRLTVEVNTDNAFRLFRDLSLQYGRIDLPGIRRTVCEHRCGSCIAYPPCSCYISIGRNDHFIPGAYTQCQHCQMQSGGTVVDTTGKFASHIGGKLFVKGICIFSAGKSGLFTYVLNGFPVGFRMRLHISCQIDSFNMCHGIILLSSVSGAKALNLDAYGLFRATHL